MSEAVGSTPSGAAGGGSSPDHGGDDEKKEEPQPAPPPLSRATSITGVNLAHHLDVYKQRQAALQAQLASLSASLKQFDIRASQAKEEEEQVRRRAAAEARKSWGTLKNLQRAKSVLPCHIVALPNDLLHRICTHIPARAMFLACSVNKRFQSAFLEREYWDAVIASELGDDPQQDLQRTGSKATEGGEISVRELKDFFRDKTQKWENIMTTLDWLHSKGCPAEVNGSKQGPWSRRNLIKVLEDLIVFSTPGAPSWRPRQIIPRVRCLCSLLGSGVQGIQEMSACALANILSSADGGAGLLSRHNGIKNLQGLLQSHSIGMQKQAARALINSIIDDELRVLHPCLGELQHTPIRFSEERATAAELMQQRVEWLCIDFTPSGSVGEPYGLTLEMKNGRLCGHGEDLLGRFTIQEATLNRSLQWASGASIDEFLGGSDLNSIAPGLQVNPGPASAVAGLAVKREEFSDVAAIRAVGHSTAAELPEVLAKFGANLRAKKFRYSYGEMVERVAGYQARYNTARTSGLVDVHCGSEHMELLKTYEAGHGDDHVRLMAFVDQLGMFGMWERGRYHHHHKMEGSSRGCFRMWQMR